MVIELFAFPPSPRAFKVQSVANQCGLHRPDPRNSWAALVKQGHGYVEALKYALNWAALEWVVGALREPSRTGASTRSPVLR